MSGAVEYEVPDRESLRELPESVLLFIFPEGTTPELMDQTLATLRGETGLSSADLDVDVECLRYILQYFSAARQAFHGAGTRPLRQIADPQAMLSVSALFRRQAIIVLREELEYFVVPPKGYGAADADASTSAINEPTASTQADDPVAGRSAPPESHANVLSETHSSENIPGSKRVSQKPSASSFGTAQQENVDPSNVSFSNDRTPWENPGMDGRTRIGGAFSSEYISPELNDLRKACGAALVRHATIFDSLTRGDGRSNDAEKHLVDMLCMRGFEPGSEWGYRTLERDRCCVRSIALVPLKTGIRRKEPAAARPALEGHAFSDDSEDSDSDIDLELYDVDDTQPATAQKLLLFWRKPACKCWWSARTMDVSVRGRPVSAKVWCRRIWTLELALV